MQCKQARLEACRDRFTPERVGRGLILEQDRLTARLALLQARDPAVLLQRGYALVYTTDGVLIRSVAQVAVPDRLRIRVANGTLVGEIRQKKEGHDV